MSSLLPQLLLLPTLGIYWSVLPFHADLDHSPLFYAVPYSPALV